MKLKYLIHLLFILGFVFTHIKAQIHFDGSLHSSFYAWENADEVQQLNFYQGIQMRIFPEKYSNLQFNSYFRFANSGDPAEWNERVYNSYIAWKSSANQFELRLGRQFVYHGVMNGTVDGILFSTKPFKSITVKFLAGIAAPTDRKLELMDWDSGNVLGAFSSYKISNNVKFNLSYFQRAKNNELIWQQLGTALSGKIINKLYFYSKFDYNLKSSDYQNMRYRLTYTADKWTFSGEFNSQRPRVYEDSFFRIFEIEAHNQIRSSVAYQLGAYQIGLRHFYTMYDDDNSNQAHLTLANKWGLLGFVYQTGYAGDNTGIFGEVKYDILKNFSIVIHSSFSSYQRQSIEIDEEALSFLGRLEYQPYKDLELQLEAQENQNSYYSNDLRGLFRLNYRFNHIL